MALASPRELFPNQVELQIPEPSSSAIDVSQLRIVDEAWFNFEVYPELLNLKFFSHRKQKWFPIPYIEIHNNCFARRMLVDLYLWGETKFRATIETQGSAIKYLTPLFMSSRFLNESWIETGRVLVVGKLRAGDIMWSNHEAVVINTNNGIRVVDPSFSHKTLRLDDWFWNFAPENNGKKICNEVTVQVMRKINSAMVQEPFGVPWPAGLPKCGYLFRQRLDAEDMVTGTNGYWGSALEKMVSRDLESYIEYRLIPSIGIMPLHLGQESGDIP